MSALMEGWQKASIMAKVIWSGGETPKLRDIVCPGTAVIAGSTTGYLPSNYQPWSDENIQAGDRIIGIPSSGPHANGYTDIRMTAKDLSSDVQLQIFRKTLTPTIIYGELVNRLIQNDDPPTSCINITGHGWRKLMRAKAPFTYLIHRMMPIPPIFTELHQLMGRDLKKMIETYNWGLGYAFTVRPWQLNKYLGIARDCGHDAIEIGEVYEGPKKVIIEPLDNMTFEGHTMNLRA